MNAPYLTSQTHFSVRKRECLSCPAKTKKFLKSQSRFPVTESLWHTSAVAPLSWMLPWFLQLAAWPEFKLLPWSRPRRDPIGRAARISMRRTRKCQDRAVIGQRGRQSFYISVSNVSRGRPWPVTAWATYGQISSKEGKLVNGKLTERECGWSEYGVIQTVIQVCVQSMWALQTRICSSCDALRMTWMNLRVYLTILLPRIA